MEVLQPKRHEKKRNKGMFTDEISGTRIGSEVFGISFQRVGKVDEKTRTAFETSHGV